ncbi:hypothetical protein IU448_00315 [Nocardia flavorosea]|uniref:SDR family oxidoreductase n=1 Tax=Nocardia flavorosea TaxID=53429 RepID=UPI00189372D6|nr:SDR family oxidoreductase [Nocardia flavorosea]MBF6347454.1 hypothetical protein [Nocardia flavorosea]
MRNRIFGRTAPSVAYAASEIAVTRRARHHAVTVEWAGAGIRPDVLAPGAILAPLLKKQLADAGHRAAPAADRWFRRTPAIWRDRVVFILSDAARFLCGIVVFVDSGSDACFRADGRPHAVPFRRLPACLRHLRGFGVAGR